MSLTGGLEDSPEGKGLSTALDAPIGDAPERSADANRQTGKQSALPGGPLAAGKATGMKVESDPDRDVRALAMTVVSDAVTGCTATSTVATPAVLRNILINACEGLVLKQALTILEAIHASTPNNPPQGAMVGTARITTMSHTPAQFVGLAADQGKTASAWLYSLEVYIAAEYDPNPLAKAVTYIGGAASVWWRETGKHQLPAQATFAQISAVFLARYHKPSDSQHARSEIPHLLQGNMSVEAYVLTSEVSIAASLLAAPLILAPWLATF